MFRRSTNNEDLLFVFPGHPCIRVLKQKSMYGDLCRYSSLVRMLKNRGESVIFVDDFEFLIYHFRILSSSIDSRTPVRIKELYHLAQIIGYLGLDDELVQQIIPIRTISRNNQKVCLPGLHKFLRQGYSEIVKIIFNSLEIPLSLCVAWDTVNFIKSFETIGGWQITTS